MLSKAISITAQAFESKLDKGGKPYILHCLRVMNGVNQNDEQLMCVAVMHDLIEDTGVTFDDLTKMGFSWRITNTLSLLTHKKEVPYDDYIKAIALNEDAR